MPNLLDTILPHLREPKLQKDGRYRAWCPFHPDGQGSPPHAQDLYVSDRGYICHACGVKGPLSKLAEHLGIDRGGNAHEVSIRIGAEEETTSLLIEGRKLSTDTLAFFGVEADLERQAWRYPVSLSEPNPPYRYKAFPGAKGARYWGDRGIGNRLYGLETIETLGLYRGDAVLWANGEPAVWACYEAGIPAVCGLAGEGNVPPGAAQELAQRGANRAIVIPDLDEAGDRAVPKVAKALSSLLQVEVRRLPEHLGKHADLGDLYVWWGANKDAFRDALEGLVTEEAPAYDGGGGEAITLWCMSDVQAEEVDWLWPPYVPKGKLTLLEGDPGVGKSWLGLAIATAVSLGRGLPGQGLGEAANVLLASAEDGLGDTIRPRLDAMGADVSRIHAIDGALTLDDSGFTLLAGYLERVRPALLVIDPLVAYLGATVDIHRANQTRHVMAQLSRLAEKYSVAILAVRHLTKGGAARPIYRGLGSIDFTAACRSVLLAGCNPENPQERALVHIKSNLTPPGVSVGYELQDGNFFWTGESTLTAAQILAADSGTETSAMDEAVAFLKEELADGPLPASQVFSAGSAAGLAGITIKRGKARLGIVARRQGEAGRRGGGAWTWALPEGHLEAQADLEYQEAHIQKDDPLNHEAAKGLAIKKNPYDEGPGGPWGEEV